MAQIDTVEVKQRSVDFTVTPTDPLDTLQSLTSKLQSMENELVDPMKLEAVTRSQLETMAHNSPRDFRFANDVHCSGAECNMGSAGQYKTATYQTSTGSRSPQAHKNQTGDWPKTRAVTQNGQTKTVSTTTTSNTTNAKGMGRTRGYNGWDDGGDIITGQLGSFQHNYQALLLGYAEVPEVPVNEEWELPNLVLDPEVAAIEQSYNAAIKEPKQLAPSARYAFNFAAPTPAISFNMGFDAPTEDVKGYVQFMDSNKNEIAVTNELSIPKGTSNVNVGLRGRPAQITNGYVNFNPSNAPKGVTVTSVSTFPPSVL